MQEFFKILNSTERTPVFVDLNWVLYKSYHVFTPDKFKSRQGLPNGHLFGLVQLLKTLDKLGYETFLCEDSNCVWRRELNSEYKATRNPSENGTSFWKDYPKIRELISDLPHTHALISDGNEADDVMFSAAKVCSRLGIKCFIHSADKDLLQSIDDNISILKKVTMKESEIITAESEYYKETFPVEPSKLPIYRAFKGDASDNLEPPVKRFPKDLTLDLVEYLAENGAIANYPIKKESHKKWIAQLCENWDSYLKNYTLMKIKEIEFRVEPKEPRGSFNKICNDYDLFQFKNYVNSLT